MTEIPMQNKAAVRTLKRARVILNRAIVSAETNDSCLEVLRETRIAREYVKTGTDSLIKTYFAECVSRIKGVPEIYQVVEIIKSLRYLE